MMFSKKLQAYCLFLGLGFLLGICCSPWLIRSPDMRQKEKSLPRSSSKSLSESVRPPKFDIVSTTVVETQKSAIKNPTAEIEVTMGLEELRRLGVEVLDTIELTLNDHVCKLYRLDPTQTKAINSAILQFTQRVLSYELKNRKLVKDPNGDYFLIKPYKEFSTCVTLLEKDLSYFIRDKKSAKTLAGLIASCDTFGSGGTGEDRLSIVDDPTTKLPAIQRLVGGNNSVVHSVKNTVIMGEFINHRYPGFFADEAK